MTEDTASEVLIAPSILSADFARLGEQIQTVDRAGADWIHVDVMDGHFVPNLTIGPVVLHWIRKATALPIDAHLMIQNPEEYIPQFAQAGADSITFHCEAAADPEALIAQIKKLRKKAGISLRPKTPLSAVLPFLPQLDVVLVMTVEPGFGGQKFMPDMMPKVRELRERIDRERLSCRVEVDGGINAETALLTVREGADVLVAGNSIFGQKDPGLALKNLRSALTKIVK